MFDINLLLKADDRSMAFEIRERDLLGRIGRLATKNGTVETPVLLPVINPNIQPISPRTMQQEFSCAALITNAYILKKRNRSKALELGVHSLLDFDGVVMTDSGAYQILVYGDVETTNREIIRFQEQIDTDIATILDLPTGWGVSEKFAQRTVEETLKSAKEFSKIKSRNDILWVGPVQGGVHLDWIAKSARKMSKIPFQIHALGSPTPVMEQYLFDTLVDMIMTAKRHLPLDRPLHLFGAGHPFMFSLAASLGCDLFDSAAYALYAREDRYMTETGTIRLSNLEYFPCSCPVCGRTSPEKMRNMPKVQRQESLARHNLHVSFAEIRRIKQAIVEGQLWEHLLMRCHGHPALLRALKRLGRYGDILESFEPASKKGGLFFYSSVDLKRPEVIRHSRRLLERYSKPEEAKFLLLLPQTWVKPFHKSRGHSRILKEIEQRLSSKRGLIHVCTYAAPFGVVPQEIDEAYPLSQNEVVTPFDSDTVRYVAEQVKGYIAGQHYSKVILLQDTGTWKSAVESACRRACKEKRIRFTAVKTAEPWNKSALNSLMHSLQEVVSKKA